MPKSCRDIQKRFKQLVNMSPSAIRSWSRDSRSRCASFEQTRKRLPALARLKAKPADSWTDADCRYAARVNSFNARHLGQMKRFGCTVRETVALRNWGHQTKCALPDRGCSTRPPAGKKPKKGPGDR